MIFAVVSRGAVQRCVWSSFVRQRVPKKGSDALAGLFRNSLQNFRVYSTRLDRLKYCRVFHHRAAESLDFQVEESRRVPSEPFLVTMEEILHKTKVGELAMNKGKVISVPDTATVLDVLHTLTKNNITAVAVAGSADHWLGAGGTYIKEGTDTQYIGIVSILDVVLHIADNVSSPDKEVGILAVNVIGQSNESRTLWTLSPNTPLLEVMEPLSKGVHRFLVPIGGKSDATITGAETVETAPKFAFLTQTDIVRFLLQNIDFLGPVVGKTIHSLGLIDYGIPPLAVPSNMELVDVLRLMRQEGGLTAMAVVAPMDGITPGSQPKPMRGGRILGTLSASDFRGLGPDSLRELVDLSVSQFLMNMSGDKPRPPVTCRPTTPLGTVMASAVTSKVHRVWVTSEDGWLAGVITFSDIIGAIRQQIRTSMNA